MPKLRLPRTINKKKSWKLGQNGAEIILLVLEHSKCIFTIVKIRTNILFNLSAHLLIGAVVFCVLFGSGAHVHTVFDLFEEHVHKHGHEHKQVHEHGLEHGHEHKHARAHNHAHIHVFVHSHNAHTKHDHSSGLGENDDHQHPIATVDIEGTLSQKSVNKVLADQTITTIAGVIPSLVGMKELSPLYLDLPPPDDVICPEYSHFFSLRGPPLG
jgi:hypothetical protein